jgi:hypothetical protein
VLGTFTGPVLELRAYGIPFVPAERNDNKRALDVHLMIFAT